MAIPGTATPCPPSSAPASPSSAPATAAPAFPEIIASAVGLVLIRPRETKSALYELEPLEAPRLWPELLRVASGRLAPRAISRTLRAVLPRLVVGARGLAPPGVRRPPWRPRP
jgi:hypothetical protein